MPRFRKSWRAPTAAAGLRFGRDYLIPKPFDPRLIEVVAPAVAQAAMDSGVAQRPIADMEAYRQRLGQFVYQSGNAMQPVFAAAKAAPKTVDLLPRARTSACCAPRRRWSTKGLARPLLLGRPEVMRRRIAAVRPAARARARLRIHRSAGPRGLRRSRPTGSTSCASRDGVSRALARAEMRSRSTLLAGAMLVRQGKADAMLCGTFGRYAGPPAPRARCDRPARRARAPWR